MYSDFNHRLRRGPAERSGPTTGNDHSETVFATQPIQRFPRVTDQPAEFRSLQIGIFCASPVRRDGLPDPIDALRRLRTCAQSPMKPAAPVRHRRALADRSSPRLRATPCRSSEISRSVAALQPSPACRGGLARSDHFASPVADGALLPGPTGPTIACPPAWT